MEEKKVAVFCSASYTIDPLFNEAAREFVTKAASEGFTIVSGGTIKGTMGVISDALEQCGGKHIGILPRFMTGLEHKGLSQTIWVDTMSVRKEMMREGTCAVVALPGGVGTLDEMIETHTLKKLAQYKGEIFVLNLGGFYDPLAGLLDYYVKTEMLDKASRDMVRFASSVEELMEMLVKLK